uniref:Secreted protein n=1 Tax=Fusarium oxysporum (strain Fo5176) TaxID=660025 RepID=A0A0D2XZI6_FUSOF
MARHTWTFTIVLLVTRALCQLSKTLLKDPVLAPQQPLTRHLQNHGPGPWQASSTFNAYIRTPKHLANVPLSSPPISRVSRFSRSAQPARQLKLSVRTRRVPGPPSQASSPLNFMVSIFWENRLRTERITRLVSS